MKRRVGGGYLGRERREIRRSGQICLERARRKLFRNVKRFVIRDSKFVDDVAKKRSTQRKEQSCCCVVVCFVWSLVWRMRDELFMAKEVGQCCEEALA